MARGGEGPPLAPFLRVFFAHHTVADEIRKMADGVIRSPARLCSRGGKICYYGRLEYDFSNSNFELVFVSRIPQIRLKKSVTEIL